MNKDKRIIQEANLNHYGNDQMNRVYGVEGISPTIKTVTGGGREVKILIREATKQGYAIAETGDSINLEHPNSNTRRGRVGKSVAQTVTTSPQQAVILKNRVRKMTPKEYLRLMGFSDSDIDILNENGISKTQLYKQAGNSIVVDVLEEIFCQIFDQDNEIWV
jgi:DNA (cytosine-5)-methyltransferase 1